MILLTAALSPYAIVRRRVGMFFSSYNGQRLHIHGHDLKRLGLRPGPDFKKILNAILYAKIDGKLESREEELELARKLVS